MKLRTANQSDIPEWISLSKEYDEYVMEIVSDLTEWYEGSDDSISFENYMKAKIDKNEAFIAFDDRDFCCGIIAVSKANNRITFFAVSHKCDFDSTGNLLLNYSLTQLNHNLSITINVIKSKAEQIQKERMLLSKFNFKYSHDDFENGVPVNSFIKLKKSQECIMENRIEILREYIDNVIVNIADTFQRRCAYLHLYGVSQACALIALKRGEDAELATMAGMLHDFYTYKFMDSDNHAEKGAVLAREVLNELKITDDKETDLICSAIHNHSAKGITHSSFDEVLVDADVMQHCLYNITKPVMEYEKLRFEKLIDEFSLN